MSLYSYSTISSPSSYKQSESSNSYCLLPSSPSITTVSSQSDNEQRTLTTDDEQWPGPPVEATLAQDHWRIEKKISSNDPQWKTNGYILKATMTKERILLHDSSSSQSRIFPGKHISMKVVFHL